MPESPISEGRNISRWHR